MKRIESSIRSKTRPDWDFRIDPVVFLHSIYMKRIKISSIRSTSNLKSISSRWTWVLRSDRLENVRAASCKHVKRIDDIGTRDYFLKTHACFTEKPEMADQRKSKKIHKKAVSLIVSFCHWSALPGLTRYRRLAFTLIFVSTQLRRSW